jgi:hypothetical protein
MRTTVDLPERLLAAARKRAGERDTTLSAVVADALRVALARPAEEAPVSFTLVTFHGDGVLPGIDLNRASELLTMEDVDVLKVSDTRRQRTSRKAARRRGKAP